MEEAMPRWRPWPSPDPGLGLTLALALGPERFPIDFKIFQWKCPCCKMKKWPCPFNMFKIIMPGLAWLYFTKKKLLTRTWVWLMKVTLFWWLGLMSQWSIITCTQQTTNWTAAAGQQNVTKFASFLQVNAWKVQKKIPFESCLPPSGLLHFHSYSGHLLLHVLYGKIKLCIRAIYKSPRQRPAAWK